MSEANYPSLMAFPATLEQKSVKQNVLSFTQVLSEVFHVVTKHLRQSNTDYGCTCWGKSPYMTEQTPGRGF